MTFYRAGRTMVLILSLAALPAFATRTHRATTATHSGLRHTGLKHKAGRARRPVVTKIRGQRQIDPDRATQIQSALIHQNYLTGTPSGQWDTDTEAAMQKYQSDHGWQTKLTPDSRALIKLGLGPNPASPATPATPNVQTAATSGPASDSGTLDSAHAIRE